MLGIVNDEIQALSDILNGEMDKYNKKDVIPILIKHLYLECDRQGITEDKDVRKFIYDHSMEVLKLNVGEMFTAQYWDKSVKDCIGKYKNREKVLHCVKEIPITEYEWNVIMAIEDDALKKIMFVLIAYRKLIMGTCSLSKGNIRLPLTYIFREARLSLRGLDQKMAIHKLIKNNYIRQNFACNDTSLILNIYENGDDSAIKFIITDLTSVITYYNEYYKGLRYTYCQMCKKRVRVTKRTPKYCKDCLKIKNVEWVTNSRKTVKKS